MYCPKCKHCVQATNAGKPCVFCEFPGPQVSVRPGVPAASKPSAGKPPTRK